MDETLQKWKNKPHGPRLQAKVISYIAEKIDMLDFFADGISREGVVITLTDIIDQCHADKMFGMLLSQKAKNWQTSSYLQNM